MSLVELHTLVSRLVYKLLVELCQSVWNCVLEILELVIQCQSSLSLSHFRSFVQPSNSSAKVEFILLPKKITYFLKCFVYFYLIIFILVHMKVSIYLIIRPYIFMQVTILFVQQSVHQSSVFSVECGYLTLLQLTLYVLSEFIVVTPVGVGSYLYWSVFIHKISLKKILQDQKTHSKEGAWVILKPTNYV